MDTFDIFISWIELCIKLKKESVGFFFFLETIIFILIWIRVIWDQLHL